MSDFRRYMEGEYEGTLIQKSVQMGADVLRAQVIEQQVISLQKNLLQSEKERIGNENQLDGSKLDELMEQYNEEDKFSEYLVDGAILTCNQATTEDFILPSGEIIALEADIVEETKKEETKDKNAELCQTVLQVKENPMSINDYKYATDKDAVLHRNIVPFRCNCKMAVNKKSEEDRIKSDQECSKHGVCMHLIRLNEKWDNMPGSNYLKKTDIYTMGTLGVADIIGQPLIVSEEETSGITMTSVLFCKHGGIISPVTSGQIISVNIFTELEEELFNQFKDQVEFDNWSQDKKDCAEEIWNKFYKEEGYDPYFVAGVIGNMYYEGSCGLLQGVDWSPYSNICKKYMVISNIEQARDACIIAPGGYAIGMVQWSTVDRKKILYNNYVLNKSEDGSLTQEQLMRAEINTIYEELKGNYSKVYDTYQLMTNKSDSANDNIYFSACIFFRDYEIPQSYGDVVKSDNYALAEGVEDRARNAEKWENVPSIIQRIIAAKVAYEKFMGE